MKPEVELFINVEEPSIDQYLWQSQLQACIAPLLEQAKGIEHILSLLNSVEISIVDDQSIAQIHGQFLNDPTPTDVITFPHGDGVGEVIVSIDTARRLAKELSIPWQEELFRYMVHGLVHLHGYLDKTSAERDELYSYQEPLVSQFSPLLFRDLD